MTHVEDEPTLGPPLPEPVFEAVRVVGTVLEDGYAAARRARVVDRVIVHSGPARRLQDRIGGDGFVALQTMLLNSVEGEDGVLRMPGGQVRLRKLLGWGETRCRNVVKQLADAGFATSQSSRQIVPGKGNVFTQAWLIPNRTLWGEPEAADLGPSNLGPAKPRPEVEGSGLAPANLGTGKPRPEVEGGVSAGQVGAALSSPEEPRPLHGDDDGSSSSSSAWGQVALPDPSARRARTDEKSVGEIAAGLLGHGVVGTPQHARKVAPLRDGAVFEEVVARLFELGFTDARRFARAHWDGPLVAWVNWVLAHGDEVAKPGAYIRSVLKAGKTPPSEPTPAMPAPVDAPAAAPVEGARRRAPEPAEVEEVDPLDAVAPEEVERIVAELPGDLADQVLEATRAYLGAMAERAFAPSPGPGAAAMLRAARAQVLFEFGLLEVDGAPRPAVRRQSG